MFATDKLAGDSASTNSDNGKVQDPRRDAASLSTDTAVQNSANQERISNTTPSQICTAPGIAVTDAKPFTSANPSKCTVPKNLQQTYDSALYSQAENPLVPKAEQKRLEPAEVVIFNNSRVDNNSKFNNGSIDDIGYLMTTFGGLQCKMTILTDATVDDVRRTMRALEEKNLENRSAVVVVILSLCHQYETIAARDGDYNIDNEIIFPLLRNRSLINTPKMLFVQATKGSRELRRFWADTDSDKAHGEPSDILKCYCTYEDYVPYQNTTGTPFIRELCNALSSKPTVDIESILEDVIKCIMDSTQKTQVPLMTSTMTTKYTFGDFI